MMTRASIVGLCLMLVTFVACEDDAGVSLGVVDGSGRGSDGRPSVGDLDDGGGGGFRDGVGGGACGQLVAIIRDFKAYEGGKGHADFENVNKDEPGYSLASGQPVWTDGNSQPYVDTTLDSEGKPKYLLGEKESPRRTIHGEQGFSQWYRDVADVNQRFEVAIIDQDVSPDRFLFDAAKLPGGQFFPIDGRGFGNQGNPHNYHFTTELRGRFRYRGGEVFSFSGDDDVYVFVNGKLALDIGGVHGVKNGEIEFDKIAGWLGISVGSDYDIALFHAERHTHASNFRFETSIRCLVIK